MSRSVIDQPRLSRSAAMQLPLLAGRRERLLQSPVGVKPAPSPLRAGSRAAGGGGHPGAGRTPPRPSAPVWSWRWTPSPRSTAMRPARLRIGVRAVLRVGLHLDDQAGVNVVVGRQLDALEVGEGHSCGQAACRSSVSGHTNAPPGNQPGGVTRRTQVQITPSRGGGLGGEGLGLGAWTGGGAGRRPRPRRGRAAPARSRSWAGRRPPPRPAGRPGRVRVPSRGGTPGSWVGARAAMAAAVSPPASAVRASRTPMSVAIRRAASRSMRLAASRTHPTIWGSSTRSSSAPLGAARPPPVARPPPTTGRCRRRPGPRSGRRPRRRSSEAVNAWRTVRTWSMMPHAPSP